MCKQVFKSISDRKFVDSSRALPFRRLIFSSQNNMLSDDIPWNCTNILSIRNINRTLYDRLCNITSMTTNLDLDNDSLPYHLELKSFQKTQCDFVRCVLWSAGSLWCGIIIGCICKIKRLLCGKAKSTQEKSTQYEDPDNRFSSKYSSIVKTKEYHIYPKRIPSLHSKLRKK